MIVDEWTQNIRPDYGSFTAGPPIIVGHCTDGPWGGIDYNLRASRAHYHVLLDVRPARGRDRQAYQLCRLSRSCGGMKQPRGGPTTNKRTAIQFSIAGPAAEMHTLTKEECVWIGRMLSPILRHYPQITQDHPTSIGPGDHSGPIATMSWLGRHSTLDWEQHTGWTQHQRAPGNDHYDIYCHEWQFAQMIATAHQQLQPTGDDDMTEEEHEWLRGIASTLYGQNMGLPGLSFPDGVDHVPDIRRTRHIREAIERLQADVNELKRKVN